MKEKIIVYIKQTGEPPTPVTVRIKWMPDGVIKPLLYWTPDGSCFQVKHIYESTALAFLKDRGEGLRFKIKGAVIKTPEPYSELLHTQHETYLYFTDKWFSGKNFIDGRYGHAGKTYITVILDIFPNGDYELIYFWFNSMLYEIEKTTAIEPRGSFEAGGVGIWHNVDIRLIDENKIKPSLKKFFQNTAELYFEVNKWFVSTKFSIS